MEEQEKSRVIIKTEKCFLDRSPVDYAVHKTIKAKPDSDMNCGNLKIKHELDTEVKQENERIELTFDIESFRDSENSPAPSNFDSPESLCEVSYEEKFYRCPYCSFETNIKKYMRIHLASETHLFNNNNKIHDRYDQDYESIAAKKLAVFELEAKLQNSNYIMTASKLFSSNPMHEASLEEKFYRCPHCPYGTNIKKCFKMHIANEIHLFTRKSSEISSESIFDNYKRACTQFSTIKSIGYDLETLPPQRVIPHILLCKICGYEATSNKALSEHTETEHRPLLKYPKIGYETGSPQKRPRSELDLEEGSNSRSKYSRMEKVVCDVCAYQAKDGIDLKVHKLKHRDISELLRHKCVYCDGNSAKGCQIRKNKNSRTRVEFVD